MEIAVDSNKYFIKLESPSVEEFINLRAQIGWGQLDFNLAKISLNNSLFHVTVRDKTKLIGIGSALMEQIEKYLSVTAKKGSTVGLLAAKGKEIFYTRYGYVLRPNNSLGHGMCRFV
mgnify:CR=1 FL=1